jgi:hypothetical protein
MKLQDLVLFAFVCLPSWAVAADRFADDVWPKIGATTCLKCHKAGGDAEESDFILLDPSRDRSPHRSESLAHNRQQFTKVARQRDGVRWKVLLKVSEQVDHGGGEVLKAGSTEYRVLDRFVRSIHGETIEPAGKPASDYQPGPFWEGITMLSERRLLRRLTLSLAGRLPADDERSMVREGGLKAVESVLDSVMNEEAFYDRLAEAFNDILLVRGYDGVAENALSYDHFEKTRHWYQKFDLSHAGDEDAQRKARYKLADDYREAMRREPLELIKQIVREDRPFTDVVTADYIMVSPYTARGYGVFDELKEKFQDPDDPLEYVPVRLAALKSRNGRVQESETGYYPHAGVLSTFQYLMRYPTTETNRNRLRARMYFQHFLGIDVMQLAPRVNDAAAITAKYEIPTMQASDCMVCHKIVDPIAGLFQDYYVVDAKGVYGPRREGWFEDIFPAGFEGEDLMPEQRWRSLQWLGQRTAADPRFAVAMVGHVYYVMTGRNPLHPPEDLDDPLFAARRRAYEVQRAEVERIARQFADSGFDLRVAFRAWALSNFYRADGLAAAVTNPHRRAELADIGLVRMLSPEQLERKLAAIFGKGWGRLDEQFQILYGGIDSEAVTERILDPSGAMGAIQRMMANHIACMNVGVDFTTERGKRRLFPNIEPDVLPADGGDTDRQIAEAIVHLHRLLLGRYDEVDSPQVEATQELFNGIVADARQRDDVEQVESWFCRSADDKRIEDPHYTVRAWRAVVTYLLRQQEFLYE